MEKIANIYSQDLDYYFSFAPDHRKYFEQDIQQGLGILKRISQVASECKQTQLAAKIEKIFQTKLKFAQ